MGGGRSQCPGREEKDHHDPAAITQCGLFHPGRRLGRNMRKRSPLGGDGKQFLKPAFAPSLSPGSLSLIRSSLQLPQPDTVALF